MNGKLPLPFSVTNFKGINLLEKKEEKEKDNFRLYPHERNQWTTFVYVEVDCNLIENLIHQAKDKEFLNLIKDSHLSLIRGHFVINHHHIKPILDSIKENTSIYHQFNICLSDLVIFKNENQSKCFLCLVDANDFKSLDLNISCFCKTIRDSILQFGFQNNLNSTEEFKFHLSLAWCKSEFEDQLKELINKLKADQLIEPVLIKVKEFKVNIGNQEYKFYLKE